MNEEAIQTLYDQIDEIDEAMKTEDKSSQVYEELLKRKKETFELIRYLQHEDPETIKAETEKDKLELERVEGKKNRIWGGVLKFGGAAFTALCTIGLMFKAHQYQNTEIFDKMDEKQIDNYQRRNND